MLNSFDYLRYNESRKTSVFSINDACFKPEIIYAPSDGIRDIRLENHAQQYGSILTLITVIKYYEDKNAYVPPKLAEFFLFLRSKNCIYGVDQIREYFSILDKYKILNRFDYSYLYLNATIHYLGKLINLKLGDQ